MHSQNLGGWSRQGKCVSCLSLMIGACQSGKIIKAVLWKPSYRPYEVPTPSGLPGTSEFLSGRKGLAPVLLASRSKENKQENVE